MSNNYYELSASSDDAIRSSARLLYVSTAKFGGDWHSTLHCHSHAELFYVLGGMGQIRIEDELHPVSTDTLVIINPNVEHTEVSYNANPLEYMVLGVSGLELSLSDHQDDRFYIGNFHGSEDLISCMKSILRETEAKRPGYETICQDYLEILVLRLMRGTNFSASLTPSGTPSNRQCAAVRRYIDAHFKESITLDTLAQVAHVNKYHMAHAFKDEYGVSPISYLISRRIEESRYLLRETDMSQTQISQVLGFSSPSYFSQSFRRVENMRPMEYRKSTKPGKKGTK